jgi:hypothetical protein
VYTHLQIDITEPGVVTERGNRYLINIIDIFAKYAWSFVSRFKNAECVLASVKSVVRDHGRFPILQHDNGGEFCNKLLEHYCSVNQIG